MVAANAYFFGLPEKAMRREPCRLPYVILRLMGCVTATKAALKVAVIVEDVLVL